MARTSSGRCTSACCSVPETPLTTRSRQQRCRLALVLGLALLFVLALLPAPDLPRLLSWQDKLEHAFAYAGLALLGALAWPQHLGRLAIILLIHGALIELAQSLTTYRLGDPWDWLADALGVSVLLLVQRRQSPTGNIQANLDASLSRGNE